MTVLRALVFNVVFFCSGAVFLTLALPALLMPRGATIRVGTLWFGFVLGALRVICGVSHEIRGRENLPPAPCIVAAKHQSAWDTFAFLTFLDDAAYVIKRELLRIPVYGWLMSKAAMVPVDRAAGAKALRDMVRAARARIAEGRNIVIFPEGTRTAPGQRRRYHPGVAALYSQLSLPVVPVALNSGLYWPRRSFVKRPGRIVVELLPPIPPGLSRGDFMARLESSIEEASARLCGPDRA
ncbi:MAG: lysophospholipid acyltransferase family protein [Kiloniellales bacterium]|jgi:1-acyl-sn-glycerol-3-phosphate acyltransferase|nr:lysophospholipid acyltransferase family protein [Kiloniellales bacterium]